MLTIDRAYFDLTGGLERWLYRLVRKHGGRQEGGWSFDLKYLHAKSGSLSPLKALRLRPARDRPPRTAARLSACHRARSLALERLNFMPIPVDPLAAALRRRGLATALGKSCESSRAIGDRTSRAIGDPILVLSGTEIGRNALALNDLPRP